MKYFIIVAVIVLIGFLWVKRLAGLVYDSEKYTKKLEQRFSYDEALKSDDEKQNSEEKH